MWRVEADQRALHKSTVTRFENDRLIASKYVLSSEIELSVGTHSRRSLRACALPLVHACADFQAESVVHRPTACFLDVVEQALVFRGTIGILHRHHDFVE